MNIRNCRECGKIYNYDGYNMCIECRRNLEGEFKIVKEYIYENPGADITKVNEETGIDVDKIISFLREGRLEIAKGGNFILECEKCGTSITMGRFCDKCASELQREFGGAIDSSRAKDKKMPDKDAKFRYIDKHRDRS